MRKVYLYKIRLFQAIVSNFNVNRIIIISIGNHTYSSPIREIIVLALVNLDKAKPSLILTIACTSMLLIGSMSFLLLV